VRPPKGGFVICPPAAPGHGFRRLVAVVLLALAPLLASLPVQAQALACREDTLQLRGPWGQARFTVEIADTDATRSRGLMFRERMARGAGMLFIYDRPQTVAFWMRNTLIPLDMIFVEEDGRVAHVHHEAVPLDETPIWGGNRIQFVLEINGGLARQLGIAVGSEMRHPRLPQDSALWPCEAAEPATATDPTPEAEDSAPAAP
jgi:uncharacterized protein